MDFMSVNVKSQVGACATCVKFQLAILTNKLFMVKRIGLTHSNCIKIWDEIAI